MYNQIQYLTQRSQNLIFIMGSHLNCLHLRILRNKSYLGLRFIENSTANMYSRNHKGDLYNNSKLNQLIQFLLHCVFVGIWIPVIR